MLRRQNPSGFQAKLLSYPRIKDGITDEDTKIVAVLGGCYQRSRRA